MTGLPRSLQGNWNIAAGWASSVDLPGVRIPGAPFMGTKGSRPARSCSPPPSPTNRRCSSGAASCFRRRPRRPSRTTRRSPPMACGRSLPVCRAATWTTNNPARRPPTRPGRHPGALFSAGDGHYAQGDCETCDRHRDERDLARAVPGPQGRGGPEEIGFPRFTRDEHSLPPEFAVPAASTPPPASRSPGTA